MSPDWNATLIRVMVESSVRVCLLAGAVALVLLVARARTGGVRHAAWTGVLLAMLLMPVLPYWVPSIELSIPSRAARVEAIPDAIESAWLDQTADVPDPLSVGNRGASPGPAAAATTNVGSGTAAASPTRSRSGWPLVVFGVYLAGALFLMARLVLGWLAVRRIVRSSAPIGRVESPSSVRPAPAVVGRVRESPLLATPMTVGILSPKILLPSAWKAWPAKKLDAVLAHECAHVRRRDPLVALLARLNLCVFWFHPVAWWLERTLATTAEHACDDAGVRVMGEKRGYAEVLLDMAEAVRRAGGRFAWDGVGVHGTGLLGQRIDRVLRGDFLREVSMTRKLGVAVGCTLAIVIVVACRQRAPELKDDPQFAAAQAKEQARYDFTNAALHLNAAQAAETEAVVAKNPEDLQARKKLLIFAVPYGVRVPGTENQWSPWCAQQIGEQRCIELRRAQILWLIEHHPDSDALTAYGRIAPAGGGLNDPAGYAEAKKLWLAQAARPDVNAAALGNAADFFAAGRVDEPLAGKMLLHALSIDPNPRWSRRLGELYAQVIGGYGRNWMPMTPTAPNGPYVQEVRKKLDDSNDARLLEGAAWWLVHPPQMQDQQRMADARALGRKYAERAIRIDPHATQAHQLLLSFDEGQRFARMRAAVGLPPKVNDTRLAALPDAERFEFLPVLATHAYMAGDDLDWRHKNAEGKAARDQARKYAEEALQLAPKFRDRPEYGTAIYASNLVLAALTFRDGDGQLAGRHLFEAANAPANDELRYGTPGIGYQVLGSMLRSGLREPVVEFLELRGKTNQVDGKRWLEDAAQIRKGYRPIWYPGLHRVYEPVLGRR